MNIYALLFPNFFFRWRNVIKEVQIGTAPSLYSVLPCITYLREQMIDGEKKEKGGKNSCSCVYFHLNYFLRNQILLQTYSAVT